MKNLQNITFLFKLSKSPLKMCKIISTFLNTLFVVRITIDLVFKTIFFVTHGLGPVKPGPRATKPITPLYVENNYRIEVKYTFVLTAYLVLLCEFF